MRLEQKFMEHKYIQRVSPYSERKIDKVGV